MSLLARAQVEHAMQVLMPRSRYRPSLMDCAMAEAVTDAPGGMSLHVVPDACLGNPNGRNFAWVIGPVGRA